MEAPETKYVRTEDGVYLAYQAFGGGPVDMVWFHGFVGSLEVMWNILRWPASRKRSLRSGA